MSTPSLIAPEQALAVNLAETGGGTVAGIVSRTVLTTPELRLVHFAFDAGQELTTHTNRRRAIVQILSGTGEILFNDRWQTLPAGSLVHLPPSHPHAVRAGAGPFTMLLTLASEPAAQL